MFNTDSILHLFPTLLLFAFHTISEFTYILRLPPLHHAAGHFLVATGFCIHIMGMIEYV